jgi:hypothetical protein
MSSVAMRTTRSFAGACRVPLWRSFGVASMMMLVAAAPGEAQRRITPFATGSIVEHRVSTTGEVERVAGAVWGVGATMALSDWMGLRGRIAGGNLSARTPDAESRSMSEAELGVVITPDRWISIDAGTMTRTMETDLVRQRWTELRAGTELGLDLIEGVLRGSVRVSIAPWVSVSGHPAPDLALGAGTGLEYTAGRLVGNLSYALDRYDFPAAATARRLEQRSTLTARIGWRLR